MNTLRKPKLRAVSKLLQFVAPSLICNSDEIDFPSIMLCLAACRFTLSRNEAETIASMQEDIGVMSNPY